MSQEQLQIIGLVADLIAVGTIIYGAIKLDEERKERNRRGQNVFVELTNGGKIYRLPFALRREEMTRAEILGRIGMIPRVNPNVPYRAEYTNNPAFLRDIRRIYEGHGVNEVLTISLSDEEFHQFKSVGDFIAKG